MGVVGDGGKKLIHAANSQGYKIGMGQRVSETGNYVGANGYYLRIKDQHLNQTATPSPTRAPAGGNQAAITLQQNFNGPANPAQVRNAANAGLQQSLTLSGFSLTER